VTIIDTKAIADRLLAKLFSRFPALFRRWVRKHRFVEFETAPWTPFTGQVDQSRVALLTTGGVHLKHDRPFDMRDPAGDPSFREIPARTTPADLTITHNYYDHRDADTDINVVFPLERLTELGDSGEIGSINHRHFSFMGHILPPHIQTLIAATGPEVAGLLKRDGVDIAILTPA
jgi:D-proline reductase (dithiol) PrdB